MNTVRAPRYWMDEETGILRRAVERYLTHAVLTDDEITLMRLYLKQWIDSPGWHGVDGLRARVGALTTQAAISAWLEEALDLAIDPL
jgi:hypothetical protein